MVLRNANEDEPDIGLIKFKFKSKSISSTCLFNNFSSKPDDLFLANYLPYNSF